MNKNIICDSDKNKFAEVKVKIIATREFLRTINVESSEDIQKCIEIKKIVNSVLDEISSVKNDLTSLQMQEIAKIRETLKEREENMAKLRKVLENNDFQEKEKEKEIPKKGKSWADVTAEEEAFEPKFGEKGVLRINRMEKIEIAKGVSIDAYKIKSITECTESSKLGFWCYFPETEKFYTCLNGHIITSACTDILAESITPKKFNTLDLTRVYGEFDPDRDYKNNNYYVKNSKKDRRVFTNRMKFFPASKVAERPDVPSYSYKVGSRTTLKADLESANDEDLDLVNDIAGHFMMVLTAIKIEQKARKNYI